jgi:hypothetical protein
MGAVFDAFVNRYWTKESHRKAAYGLLEKFEQAVPVRRGRAAEPGATAPPTLASGAAAEPAPSGSAE